MQVWVSVLTGEEMGGCRSMGMKKQICRKNKLGGLIHNLRNCTALGIFVNKQILAALVMQRKRYEMKC